MDSLHRTSENLRSSFDREFARRPEEIVHAPGRVSLLGGHADYNEGFVLPAAIDLYTHAAIAHRDDRTVRMRSLNFGETCSFRIGAAGEIPDWAEYVRGIVEELSGAGKEIPGFDLLVHGEVPIGSGLSSSATLTVAVTTALDLSLGLKMEPTAVVELCRRAEERYAGVPCGVMDPFASYLGRADHALLVDCRTLEHEEVPLPAGYVLVVLDSGVRRKLARSEFGSRREECTAAVRAIRDLTGEPIVALRDVTPDQLRSVMDRLPPTLRRRAAHVVSDLPRTIRGTDAIRQGDLREFGAAMFETHASLRDLYDVSTPELDYLVDLARDHPGVVGARLTGAGFGGCVACLAREEVVPELQKLVERRFRERFGTEPTVSLHRPSDGARRLHEH